MYGAAAPFWAVAGRKVRATLAERAAPAMALLSAFCFVAMMFAVPLPGGTTGHPVGATLVAIVLGPWAAVLGVSITLAIQAAFFGDGGITAFGANCFNMAIVMPFVGFWTYRLLSGGPSASERRRVLAAAAAGYVALNVAAFTTAVQFGIQPLLFRASDGRPLYSPYPLSIAVPGMMLGHLLVAGPAEAFVTALALRFLIRANPEMLVEFQPRRPAVSWRAWAVLALVVVLTPLGLLATGSAWGEWGAEGLQKAIGFVPQGISRLGGLWRSPIPDYEMPALGSHLGYIASGFVGVLLVVAAAVGLAWFLFGRSRDGYRDRSLAGILGALHEGVAAERLAARPGLLQSVDARAKLIGALAMLVAAAAAHTLPAVLILWCVAIAAAWASGMPPWTLVTRVVGVALLFTAAFSLPALLNVVTPGEPILVIGRIARAGHSGPFGLPALLAITRQGAVAALLLTARAAACVTWAWLAVATTRRDLLFSALRSLGLPAAVVDVLAMTYRYLVVLLKCAADMMVAKKSRSVGHMKAAAHREVLGGVVASLMGKASHLGQQVHLARVSRGYFGVNRAASMPNMKLGDAAWLLISIAGAVLLTLADRRLWW